MQQHMDMNDAGNFLIETCDETVSRDLKQQLLLLNGRWRELFVKVKHVGTMLFWTTVKKQKHYDTVCVISLSWSIYCFPLCHWQYARADEVDKLRQDYQDGINTLKMFMDATNEKMNAPVQVSFLNVRAFVQDVEVMSWYAHSFPHVRLIFHLFSVFLRKITVLCIPSYCRKSNTKCQLWKPPVRQRAVLLSCWPKTLHKRRFHRWWLWWHRSKSSWARCVHGIIQYVIHLPVFFLLAFIMPAWYNEQSIYL